jgi:enoyl-CoA hydratase
MDDSVLAWREGRIGRIRLNRPQALNAVDLVMLETCRAALDRWRDDPEIHAVLIEGAGERAFCAGGDIRTMREYALRRDRDSIETFFRVEYGLNRTIAEFPKPYVAMVDGICMGGGVGLSVHGTVRVATERAVFAMPETAIGFFPDVGASYFLPRMPGALGTYYGLTGARASSGDAIHAGFATHYIPGAAVPALTAALVRDGMAVLAAHAETPPAFSLHAQREAIDRCFGCGTVVEICRRLEAEQTDWALQTLETLRAMSPSSLVWALANIRKGARRTLRQCLAGELALTRTLIPHHEFVEGVRAMVVDKDRRPRWDPARVEDVDAAAIAEAVDFEPPEDAIR